MRKIALLALMSLCIVSCQSEESQVTETMETVSSLKSDTMKNFDKALIKLSKGKERYVDQNKRLNEEGVEILFPIALSLAIENGNPETDLKKKSKRDIIEKGFKVYQENLTTYRARIKSNN